MNRRHRPLLAAALLAATLGAAADNTAPAPPPALRAVADPGDGRLPGVRGYYYTDIDGEEVKMLVLNEVTVFPRMKPFKNKKQEEFYWRTVRDVKKTLPWAKLISETLVETYEYIETIPDPKERQDHLKRMESAIFEQYKPVLKKFTKGQAQMLLKMIRRETSQSSYNILKAFLGSFRANFWQVFGRFFGVNLKSDYRPDSDEKDAMIERVAVAVELGMI